MSDFNLSSKSKIKENQLIHLAEQAKKKLKKDFTKEELETAVNDIIVYYKQTMGEPLLVPIRADRNQLPFKEDVLTNMDAISSDMEIITEEHNTASHFIVDSFNYMHSEKKRLNSRIQYLNNMIGDVLLLSGTVNENVQYFKESFQNAASHDKEFALEGVSEAYISSNEGILTLKRSNTTNLSKSSRIGNITGNGEPGNENIAKRIFVMDQNKKEKEQVRFISDLNPNKSKIPESMLDQRPDTIFEYQMINVPESFKRKYKYYDFDWSKGNLNEDKLRVKITIDLKSAQNINWIQLNPFFAENTTGKIVIHNIQTSVDGFEYKPLYENTPILNQEVHQSAQTYELDKLFNGEVDPAQAQYTGRGVWSFPQRTARFVEFTIDQDESHPEQVGQAIYMVENKSKKYITQVPEPVELEDSDPGEYTRILDGDSVVYKKEIIPTEGWRYAIGIRDINILQYEFEEKSMFVSKKYTSEKEIRKITLYANEIIPKEYQDIVKINNDWIVYEISFDDTNWLRISPMHHEPLNDNFAPKIIQLNGSFVDLDSAFKIHKETIQTSEPVFEVRMRITLKRPKEKEFLATTPLLEDVALQIEVEDEIK